MNFSPSSRVLLWLFLALLVTVDGLASSFGEVAYLDSGVGLDVSHLVERQANVSLPLKENFIVPMNILPGATDFWTFPASLLDTSTANSNTTLYITVNTCTQPIPNVTLNSTEVYLNSTLPALQLYVSTDTRNSRPGPGSEGTQTVVELVLGFGNVSLTGVSGDVFLSVHASNPTSDWQGGWSYELGTSTTRTSALSLSNNRTATTSSRGTESVRD
jgi:Stretch-activated Ca2+-permeable channel component